MGRPKKWTDAQLIARLRAVAKGLGRSPRFTEVSSLTTVLVHRFGSFNQALAAAGLPFRARGGRHRIVKHRALSIVRRATDIRDYWRQVDPAVCSAERSDAARHSPATTWRHPYARQRSA